jgi:hypothetical protein
VHVRGTVGRDSLGALKITLTAEQCAQLDTAGAVEAPFPHDFLRSPLVMRNIFGTAPVQARR